MGILDSVNKGPDAINDAVQKAYDEAKEGSKFFGKDIFPNLDVSGGKINSQNQNNIATSNLGQTNKSGNMNPIQAWQTGAQIIGDKGAKLWDDTVQNWQTGVGIIEDGVGNLIDSITGKNLPVTGKSSASNAAPSSSSSNSGKSLYGGNTGKSGLQTNNKKNTSASGVGKVNNISGNYSGISGAR